MTYKSKQKQQTIIIKDFQNKVWDKFEIGEFKSVHFYVSDSVLYFRC